VLHQPPGYVAGGGSKGGVRDSKVWPRHEAVGQHERFGGSGEQIERAPAIGALGRAPALKYLAGAD
jgi:hypothetical protein